MSKTSSNSSPHCGAPVTLILGGCRSGKSARAEQLAAAAGLPVTYVSTCHTAGVDPEMLERIRLHRARRPPGWATVENRADLAAVFREHAGRLILLDCLTLWISWMMGQGAGEDAIRAALEEAFDAGSPAAIVIVSNEVGFGLVPPDPESRLFRDISGRMHQRVASRASRVELVVAGLPLAIKG